MLCLFRSFSRKRDMSKTQRAIGLLSLGLSSIKLSAGQFCGCIRKKPQALRGFKKLWYLQRIRQNHWLKKPVISSFRFLSLRWWFLNICQLLIYLKMFIYYWDIPILDSGAINALPFFPSPSIKFQADLFYVSKQLGHSGINITSDIYGHFIPSEGNRQVDLLDSPAPASILSAPKSLYSQKEKPQLVDIAVNSSLMVPKARLELAQIYIH